MGYEKLKGPVLVTLEPKLPSSSRTPSDAPAFHALTRPPASSRRGHPPLLISLPLFSVA
ncbi:hypothetical protein M405DRAFT_866883 [Rhizopogon salebrosus TDB-379]|nr:hypothetical protein M405DRAFT_866883 [Rhizopogon salebrosus TDB-379]